MPINCVVGGCCRNQNNSPDSSFYRFPSDFSHQRLWVRFVDNTRADFVRTPNSRVCSAHFVHDDFEPSSLLKRKFGIPGSRLLLKPGTVPSVKRRTEQEEVLSSPSKKARTCTCTNTCTSTDNSAHTWTCLHSTRKHMCVYMHIDALCVCDIRCEMGLCCTGGRGLFWCECNVTTLSSVHATRCSSR